MRGARGWEKDGVTDQIEPAGWEQVLAPTGKGVVRLDQEKSVSVALLNSREYQTALEDVYLSALSLTLNRFEFDLRWFGRTAPTFTHFGSGLFPQETNTLAVDSGLGFNRNLAAGGQLLAEFANSIVYEFSGKSSQVRSNFLVTLTQPLLRNFGRKVRLEGLTQAERDVLYTVRDFVRFRKQFWASIAVQRGGYLDLLLAVQTLRNTEVNLAQQEEIYRLYTELFRGGRASVVELDQFYQSLQAARQSVIDARADLESAQDQFKLSLGVPPRVPVELDARLLEQFTLTDPNLDRLSDELEEFQRARLRELDAPPSAADLRQAFAELRTLTTRIPDAVRSARADLDAVSRRFAQLPAPADDPELRSREQATFAALQKALAEADADAAKMLGRIDREAAAVRDDTLKESWDAVTQDATLMLAVVDGVVSIQSQARVYRIELPAIGFEPDAAMDFAKANRLDLQNALGGVTDAWRKVTVAANALRGDVTVVASANLATDPDHRDPFNFAAEASTYTVGLQLDAPLNRLAERNVYRASLVNYQRAKRDYMALSDAIEAAVRQDFRQLNRLRAGFEIARQQLLSAARQYENARLTLLGPQNRRGANDATTLNLLQALTNLLSARNALAQNFIAFEQQRVQLLLDLEYLQLDPHGFPTNASPQRPLASGPASGGAGRADPLPAQPAPAAEPLPAPRPAKP